MVELTWAGETNHPVMVEEDQVTNVDPMPTRFLPDEVQDSNCLIHFPDGSQLAVVETRVEVIGIMKKKGVTLTCDYGDSEPRQEEIYPEWVYFLNGGTDFPEDMVAQTAMILSGGLRKVAVEDLEAIQEKFGDYKEGRGVSVT